MSSTIITTLPSIQIVETAQQQVAVVDHTQVHIITASAPSSASVPTTITETLNVFWEAAQAKTYTLSLKSPYAGVIAETTTKCASGTATASFAINGTPLGGAANNVSSSEQSRLHASANSFSAGDTIAVTFSSIAALRDCAVSLHYTRALA